MQKTISLAVVVFSLSCSWFFGGNDLKSAEKAEDDQKFESAIMTYERIVKSEPDSSNALEAARHGSKLCYLEKKDYRKAIFFFKHLVLYSPDEKERVEAQKTIADIYFERLADHEQAINEYNKLLELKHSVPEQIKFRMNLAKSYFFLSKFQQAESETDIGLGLKPTGEELFELLLLKGNIYFSTKQLDKAAKVFNLLIDQFPQKAKEEHVGINLAICYEENNKFEMAKEVLAKIRSEYPNPQFIDAKMKQLEQREAQLPGARGLRK